MAPSWAMFISESWLSQWRTWPKSSKCEVVLKKFFLLLQYYLLTLPHLWQIQIWNQGWICSLTFNISTLKSFSFELLSRMDQPFTSSCSSGLSSWVHPLMWNLFLQMWHEDQWEKSAHWVKYSQKTGLQFF